MKILKLKLNCEGFSVNQMYGRDHRLTTAARRWQLECKKQLIPFDQEIKNFKESININEEYIHASYIFKIPSKKLLTVAGKVSHQSKDLDGLLKILQDSIFNYMVMDDTIVCSIDAKKKPGPDFEIEVELSVLPLLWLKS
jgi:Holliday junction resolvase RusA-like endonuclease